jgi:putative endonuclease
LKKRLQAHNNGDSSHTAKHAPWELVTYIAFRDKESAQAFEF